MSSTVMSAAARGWHEFMVAVCPEIAVNAT
jgi:hypothetical protein